MAEYFTGVWCETAGTDFGSRWTGYTLGSCFRRCWCSTDCYHECRKDTENDKIKEYGFERKKGCLKKAITLDDYKERYEILKKYQAFLKAQREKK